MEIVTAPYDTAIFFNDVVNMIDVKAKQKQLDFQVDIDSTLPSVLHGDEVRNRQIIVNILNNAVKYTKQVIVKLTVEGIREGVVVTLKMQVKDSGIGIKKEDMDKLFGGFQRLDLEQNRSIEGTGLGLAITNNLVESMKGRIEVESEYGKGSVFTVFLTQEIIDDTPMGDFKEKFEAVAKQEKGYKESFVAPDAKVLIVDDNDMNLAVAKALLKKTDIQITTCMSGMECLELIQKEYFDVILLDHMMPGMDGIQTLEKIKQTENMCKSVPVIALTANAIVGAKEQYIKAGFSDYLSKPIQGAELEKMLLKYLPEDRVSTSQKADIDKGGNEIEENNTLSYISKKVGLQYCMDSMDFYKEMLGLYCDGYEERVATLKEALEKEDWEIYTVTVHGLKSTSLNIGGEKVSKAAKELEEAGKKLRASEQVEDSKEFIKEHHDAAMKLYQATVEEARIILEE